MSKLEVNQGRITAHLVGWVLVALLVLVLFAVVVYHTFSPWGLLLAIPLAPLLFLVGVNIGFKTLEPHEREFVRKIDEESH